MSYNPGTGGPRYPGPPPVYPQRTGHRVNASRPASRSRAGFGCLMFLLGAVVAAVIAGVTVFFLYFYNPNPDAPLARPADQAGTPDINATLSQTYLNREISRQLSGKPFKAGPVDIRDVVVKVQADNRLDINMRASSGPATFDLSVTEQLTVENGKVVINVVGQPKVTGGQLPPSINSVLEAVNTQFVEPQINNQVTQITLNQRPIKLVGISSTPGFLMLKANVE